jgi:ferritin-like metal-binding protein YciE
MENAKERIIRYLQEAHAAEKGIDQALQGFIDETDDPTIKALFEDHLLLTRSQARRLEDRLKMLNADVSGPKSFITQLMARGSELLHTGYDEYDRNTQNLIKAYATEHLERGMYEALYTYATAVGDTDTARLAREIQMEEELTAEKIFPLIDLFAQTALAATKAQAYPA